VIVYERAPAKLNLALEIVRRREDGMHDLATIFQTVGLFDDLTAEASDDLTLTGDTCGVAPTRNLVWRAADRMRRESNLSRGARLDLVKRIPLAAGLGGGSANAAATLRALRRLWSMASGDAQLHEIARELGADVPFLLRGGTAFAQGVGDEIERLPDLTDCWFVILTPCDAPADKTRRAYAALEPTDRTDGGATRELSQAIRRGQSDALGSVPNAFERGADRMFPSLPSARAAFRAAGAPWVRLSGSGPTLFTAVASRGLADSIAAALPTGTRRWVVEPVGAALAEDGTE
jgi:4-diphosphocytidyl-2-C-methyl-D-erythritol kinase